MMACVDLTKNFCRFLTGRAIPAGVAGLFGQYFWLDGVRALSPVSPIGIRSRKLIPGGGIIFLGL